TGEDKWKRESRYSYPLAFSPDGTTIVIPEKEGELVFSDVATGDRKHTLSFTGEFLRRCCFSADGSKLAFSCEVKFKDPDSGKTEKRIHLAMVTPSDGKTLWCVNTDRRFNWDLRFSPDGEWVVLVSSKPSDSDQDLILFDPETGRTLGVIQAKGLYYPLSFSGDGQRIAAGRAVLDVAEIKKRLAGTEAP
ncbi:MAG: hypothetical protein N2C14_15565, partial [Planctomycetales bacterium]